MRFLKADNVVRLERRQWIQEALSYSTTRHEGLLQEYGLTYPFPVGAGVLQVFVKHRVANVDVDAQEEHNLGDYHMICTQWCDICLHWSTRLGQRPFKEPRSRRPTRRGAEKRISVACSIRFTGGFNLCQLGLTSSQPNGCMKVASRSVEWTVALNLIGFTMMRHMVILELTSAHVDGYLR